MRIRHPLVSSLSLVIILVAATTLCPAAQMALPDDPAGTITAVASAVHDGHPEVLWQALPLSWQQDVVSLTHLFADTVDPAVYDGGFQLVQRAIRVAKAKKPLLLDGSLAQMAGDDRAAVGQKFDQTMTILEAIATSDIATHAGLRKLDWGEFLHTTGGPLIASFDAAAAKDDEPSPLAKLEQVKAETLSRDGDRASVRVSAPGEDPETVALVKVEGRWVPSELADEWHDKIAEARAGLEAQDPAAKAQTKSQMMVGMATANAVLDQIEAAKTSEELDNVLGGLLGGLGGMMAMGMPPGGDTDAPAGE